MLRSFNGLEPGGPESTDKKVKERRRLTFLGLRRKPIRPLAQGVLRAGRQKRAVTGWSREQTAEGRLAESLRAS